MKANQQAAKAAKAKNPRSVGPIGIPHDPGVDSSTQAPQGGAPTIHDRNRPQYNAPPPPDVYFLTLEQAQDIRNICIADGAIPPTTTIWENGLEIGFSSPAPAIARPGRGMECLALKWYDEDGRPQSQQAGFLYYRLLELRSAADRLGNPIPKFKRTDSGIWAA